MKLRNIICMSAVATCIAFSVLAQGLPKANQPEEISRFGLEGILDH
jgi:hypothetical protein